MTFVQSHDVLRSCKILLGFKKETKIEPCYVFDHAYTEIDFRIMTLSQDYGAPLGHRQYLREVQNKSKVAVESYHLGMNVDYLCIVALTFETNIRSMAWHTLGL